MITASLSSNVYNKAVWRDCLAFGESKINLLQYCSLRRQTFLFRSALCWFFTFPRGKSTCAESISRDESPRAEGCSTSVAKSPRSDAKIPSILEPASEELTFDPVVLRATEACFRHVQHLETKCER